MPFSSVSRKETIFRMTVSMCLATVCADGEEKYALPKHHPATKALERIMFLSAQKGTRNRTAHRAVTL